MSWYIRQSFTYVHLLMLHNLKANFSWLVVRNWMQTLFSGGKVLWLTHSSRSPWLGLSRSLYCCTRGAPLEVALEEYQAACWQWRQAGQWWSGDLSAIWFVFVDFEKLREYLWCLHSENKAMGCLCLEHNRAGWTIFFFFLPHLTKTPAGYFHLLFKQKPCSNALLCDMLRGGTAAVWQHVCLWKKQTVNVVSGAMR